MQRVVSISIISFGAFLLPPCPQGKYQQQLALKEQALAKSEESSAEMRRRLQQLNTTYITSGDKLRADKAAAEAQLAAKEAALEAERSAKLDKLTHLETSHEQLRLSQVRHLPALLLSWYIFVCAGVLACWRVRRHLLLHVVSPSGQVPADARQAVCGAGAGARPGRRDAPPPAAA
jgi:hypothetical protein